MTEIPALPVSALQGVIEKLRKGEKLSDEAIDEIDRLLGKLQGEGWSGAIPADDALRILVNELHRAEAQLTSEG
jgi:hypothetical protein